MDSLGIIFELQWKRKQGVGNRGSDIASLGIWDTADSSLDWRTFKSYLSQNLGTSEDITVAYVDSEGDELPIESECEFREALKFARQRARKGHNIILKVDKEEMATPSVAEVLDKKRWRHMKQGRSSTTEGKRNSVDKPFKKILVTEWEDLQSCNTMLVDKLANMRKAEEQQKKTNLDRDDVPPAWFKKYMQKMKTEIISEVNNHTRQMLANMVISPPAQSVEKPRREVITPKSKKRNSDEESSDAALGNDQKDHKLFRKIEKLHKFQKKWDTKLEKLENKTKRMMEKKSQARERVPEKKSLRKRSSDGPVCTYLMDAILLNDGPKAETHIKLGKRFTKIWEIMNNGTLPWTDKTELRLAWGTLGLEPEDPVVKCPILEPGEKGQIAVNFRAPDFSGTFESYWHFYHMGERFGHWIGCAVVVEEPVKCDVKVDNIEDQNLDKPLRVAMRLDEAANSQNVNNIEVEADADIEVVNMAATHPNNNNINAAQASGNPQPRGAEYESESDDDNLSIISTFSSESDDEKFVIVPMPACFMRGVPLGSENVPVVVKDGLDKHSNASEKADSVPRDVAGEAISEDKESGIGDNNMAEEEEHFSSIHSYEVDRWWDSEESKPSVYAVDAGGSCIPVENAWPLNESTRIPLGYAAKPVESPTRKSNDSNSAGAAAPDAGHTFSQSSQTSNVGGARKRDAEQSASARSSADATAVHILPETIVNGAINVASSAYSKAQALIGHLRANKPGVPNDGVSTCQCLRILSDMGFPNRSLNLILLQRFDNDIAEVVAELLRVNSKQGGH